MTTPSPSPAALLSEIATLKLRLEEAEGTLEAIHSGAVDALLISGRVLTIEDQTELLRNAYAEQKAIYDAATVGIALAHNRVIQRCNRTMEQLFGYGPGELIGQCASILYADIATYNEFGHRFTAGLKRQGYCQEEIKMVRNDGRCGFASRRCPLTRST